MSSIRAASKALAHGIDRVRPPADGLVVLIYHRVGGDTASEIDLPTALFDEQMAYLAEHSRVLSLSDGVAALRDKTPIRSAVTVTFDDGTADFVETALPILERYQIPATLYAATEFIDTGRSFFGVAPPVSWAGLRDALETGLIEVGSHTHRHLLLDRASPAEIDNELDSSIDLIEAELGVPARHFAYPKAVVGSSHARTAVAARFESAALAGTKANPWTTSDLQALARSPIQTSDAMKWFQAKLAGGLGLEDRVRQRLNQRRYRDLTT